MQRGKIKGLDGVRAIAVLLVVFSHHMVYEAMGVDRAAHPELAQLLNPSLGVKIFFVLSGFLITYLLLREHDRFGKVNLLHFYARRAFRLLPLYFLVITLLLVMTLLGSTTMNYRSFLYLFTYTQNFMPAEYNYAAISHLWSLAVEEHFYFVWPLLFVLGRKVALGAAATFTGLALLFGDNFPTTWTFPAALGITVGCLLAYAVRSVHVQRFMTHVLWGRVVLALSLAGLFSPWFGYRTYFFLPAVAGLIAYVFLNQDSWVTKVLDIKPLALIGVMSYGIYVWHAVLGGTGPYRTPDMKFPMEMRTGFILTFVVAPMSYYGFEKPFLAIKDRFRQRGQQAPEEIDVSPTQKASAESLEYAATDRP